MTVGGILNASNLTLQNSTVAFNSAGRGGGIVSSDASTLANVTVAHNQGGGVHLLAGTNTARSTIVAANTAAGLPSNCTGTTFVSTGFNVDEGDTCGFTRAGRPPETRRPRSNRRCAATATARPT